MLIIDPPATAGGTDLLQVRLLTFEAKPKRISVVLPTTDQRSIQ